VLNARTMGCNLADFSYVVRCSSVIHDCFEFEEIIRKERARELELHLIPWSQRYGGHMFFSILLDLFLRVISWIYGFAWAGFFILSYLLSSSTIQSFPSEQWDGLSTDAHFVYYFHYFWAPVIRYRLTYILHGGYASLSSSTHLLLTFI
jgi:hypothetical protein